MKIYSKIIFAMICVFAQIFVVEQASARKRDAGTIIGGVVGGILGHSLGKGNGRVATTVIGIIAGSVIGSEVGESLDEADQAALQESQRRCLEGDLDRDYDWDGSDYRSRTDAHGRFRAVREGRYYQTGTVCREYYNEIYVNGRTERNSGYACQSTDGSWFEAHETEVVFDEPVRQHRRHRRY